MRSYIRFPSVPAALAACLILVLSLAAWAGPIPPPPALTPQASGAEQARTGVLYQYSTLEALAAGAFDGNLTVGELKTHGDFGLGTFNGLDGEMVVLDGVVYRVAVSGEAAPVDDARRIPYAAVTAFSPNQTFELAGLASLDAVKAALEERLLQKGWAYALRVEGEFEAVRTRSVPRFEPPYPTLAEAVKRQAEFELGEPGKPIKGMIVALRGPTSFALLGVPGYHFHFLSANRRSGGHLLACAVRRATVSLMALPELVLRLPDGFAGTTAKGPAGE